MGIPFKFEYIPDLNFTRSQAQGNYSSKVHYTFQAKTVKRGNRAVIELNDTSGCLDSSTISDLKDKGYWRDDGTYSDYAAFPPGFIVVSEMPHAGVQLLKTKMLWEIPMNGTSHWVTLHWILRIKKIGVDIDRSMRYNIDMVRKKIRNTLGRVFLISGFSWKSVNQKTAMGYVV